MKPNFLVIGAAKCGSSTLSSLLGFHPEIYMLPHEVGFFARDETYLKGMPWYDNLFLDSNSESVKCIGEKSNIYTMKELYPKTIDRLLKYVKSSDLKLIYIVRNPLEMIESFWIEKRSHGREDVHYDFNVAVKRDKDWLVNVANYWVQIEHYRKYFSDQQIHIVFLEDLKADQRQVMADCYSFLGVDPKVSSDLPLTKLNPSKAKKLVSPLKSRLRQRKGYKAAVSLLPMPARRFLTSKLFTQKVESRPEWDMSVKEWAIQELAQDTARFLEFSGKGKDFWPLKPSLIGK